MYRLSKIFLLLLICTKASAFDYLIERNGQVLKRAGMSPIPAGAIAPIPKEFRNIDTAYLTISNGVVSLRPQAELDAIKAEAEARQQAAQVAQLQAIVDAAGDQVRQLEAIIDKYNVPRPALPMVCLAVIGAAKDAAKASNDAMGVAEAGADGVILLTLYSGLADAGVDAATVNAAWQYMVATGQDGAE